MTKVRLQGPENSGGFSREGASYDADEDGVIEVPSEIVSHAKAHGFGPAAAKAAPKPLAKSTKADEPEAVKPEPAQKAAKTSGAKGGAE